MTLANAFAILDNTGAKLWFVGIGTIVLTATGHLDAGGFEAGMLIFTSGAVAHKAAKVWSTAQAGSATDGDTVVTVGQPAPEAPTVKP